MNGSSEYKNRNCLFLSLLILFVFLIYSNTFHVPFHFDDIDMIKERSEIMITTITPENIVNTFFLQTMDGKKLYRPISSLSFAINYYFGRNNLPGYHFVNISIHIVTSIFLYFTILSILNCINIDNKYLASSGNIAGLATLLWAVHPIHTQSVTYIVQRMASLSAMFYIIGIWSYLKFRKKSLENHQKKLGFMFISILSFFCATMSKENASVFPICILLVEYFFLKGHEKIKHNIKYSAFIAISIAFIPLAFAIFFYNFRLTDVFLSGYETRPFNLSQRLLTESRIIVHYITQIIYPIPNRFSIDHSFVLSETPFYPLSTLLSIILISLLTGLTFVFKKKWPFISFPILFYLIHHSIESSILPLELVFEHRNYLPSFFLFLPISIGLFSLMSFYKNYNKKLYYIIMTFVIILIFLFGLSTHIRNNDWRSVESLWQTALSNAPSSMRPYNNLGHYYSTNNQLPLGLYYYEKGLDKNITINKLEKVQLLLNIAKTKSELMDFQKAEKTVLEALEILFIETNKNLNLLKEGGFARVLFIDCYLLLSERQYYLNLDNMASDIDDALSKIEEVFVSCNDYYFYNIKSVNSIHKKQYQTALFAIQKSLSNRAKISNQASFQFQTYFLTGYILTHLGYFERGLWFYNFALNKPGDYNEAYARAKLYFHIANNRYMAQKIEETDKYIKMGIKIMPVYSTLNYLNSKKFDNVPFVDKENFIKIVKEKYKNILLIE